MRDCNKYPSARQRIQLMDLKTYAISIRLCERHFTLVAQVKLLVSQVEFIIFKQAKSIFFYPGCYRYALQFLKLSPCSLLQLSHYSNTCNQLSGPTMVKHPYHLPYIKPICVPGNNALQIFLNDYSAIVYIEDL